MLSKGRAIMSKRKRYKRHGLGLANAVMSGADLTSTERDQLARLSVVPDDEIDTGDIPEAPAEHWRKARRGTADSDSDVVK
jgi:hypothetical protein